MVDCVKGIFIASIIVILKCERLSDIHIFDTVKAENHFSIPSTASLAVIVGAGSSHVYNNASSSITKMYFRLLSESPI